jgi:hypothetical protein
MRAQGGLRRRQKTRLAVIKSAIDINRLVPAWAKLREVADIGPIRNEAHYLRMSLTLESLLELAAGDETHPAGSRESGGYIRDSVGQARVEYPAGAQTQ